MVLEVKIDQVIAEKMKVKTSDRFFGTPCRFEYSPEWNISILRRGLITALHISRIIKNSSLLSTREVHGNINLRPGALLTQIILKIFLKQPQSDSHWEAGELNSPRDCESWRRLFCFDNVSLLNYDTSHEFSDQTKT